MSDLTREVGASKTTIGKVVRQLQLEGFLAIKELGRLWQISAVPRHPYFITRKIPMNIRYAYEYGIVDDVLRRWPEARSIVLFGSYRKGDDDENSDMDIAIEVLDDLPQAQILKLGEAKLGFRTKPVTVNGLLYNRRTVDKNVFASIANGFVLHGFLEVKPA
jgi:predicted nucleotidyltransferase